MLLPATAPLPSPPCPTGRWAAVRGEAGCDLHPTSCTALPQKGAKGEGSTSPSSSSLQASLQGRGMWGLKQPLRPTGCPYPNGASPKNGDEHPARAGQSRRARRMLCRALAGQRSQARCCSLICPPQTRVRCEEVPCPLPRRALPFFSLKKTQNNKPSSQLLPGPEAELQGAAQGRQQLPACLGGQSRALLAAHEGNAGAFPPYGCQK